jgi:hypothetical protein
MLAWRSKRQGLAAVLIVAALLAAACGEDDDSDADQLAEERLQQEEIEAAEEEAARDARQAERIRQLEKQVDEEEAASTPAPAVEPATYTTYTADEAGWSAEVPSGGGWSDPTTTEEVPGRRWRTVINGPGEIFVIVDSTPTDVPVYEGPAQRTTVSHPIYGPVTEVVFQAADSRIADCQIGTCVDYLVPNNEGGGYGVLAGGPGHSFEELQGIAMRVMQSIRYYDY